MLLCCCYVAVMLYVCVVVVVVVVVVNFTRCYFSCCILTHVTSACSVAARVRNPLLDPPQTQQDGGKKKETSARKVGRDGLDSVFTLARHTENLVSSCQTTPKTRSWWSAAVLLFLPQGWLAASVPRSERKTKNNIQRQKRKVQTTRARNLKTLGLFWKLNTQDCKVSIRESIGGGGVSHLAPGAVSFSLH